MPLGLCLILFVQLQKWLPSQGEEHRYTESTLEAYHSASACLPHPPALTVGPSPLQGQYCPAPFLLPQLKTFALSLSSVNFLGSLLLFLFL